ncbi:hypothetical protein COW83_05020 [Candidatus Collierbacteria bacterium CG22_combo_CG10-13_8_21_14_all_43_12]|uniref:Type 4 fimbrial biogenesis protein PilX N-terminal domain-containing protein n=1 Tax=Candidatus Collierbacteria bacterium CG22_combo_CG10-13_8_21_14_all_43_12 TaxID=1974537 RepID=A0A2H0DT10_9BACT|nr:MAG: hypothetical protein COW83_05020 [Candidatus Collierbacteria bacterium CG22_combo_CG10-13_8_21_14_all_43_12]
MMEKSVHTGQVALIVVLIMTVVSAMAVSVASRSTLETRIQQMNVENLEAQLTAQSGLENAVAKNQAIPDGTLGEGKTYSVSLSDVGAMGISSETISAGETFEVNLEGSVGVTGVKIYWKKAGGSSTPAIFVSDIRETQIVDYAYDTNGSNGFSAAGAGGSVEGVTYDYATPAPIAIDSIVSKKLRITVLGASALLGIEPIGGIFPAQTSKFRAIADVAATDQKVVRYGIEYVESKTDQLPSVFDNVLFSGGSLVQ